MFLRFLRKSFWLLVCALIPVVFLTGSIHVVQASLPPVQPVTILPDLAVTIIGYNKAPPFCDGDTIYFYAQIANKGNADAVGFRVDVYLDGKLFDSGKGYSLGSGQLDNIQTEYPWKATEGFHTIAWVLDSEHWISESDENNNAGERGFEVHRCECILSTSVRPPDSGVIIRSPSKDTYDCGQEVTLTARPNSCWNFREWGGEIKGENRSATINVNRDMEVTAYFEQWCKPDLIVEDITWRPSNPQVNDEITISFRVKNIGDEMANDFGQGWITEPNGPQHSDYQIGSLAKGETKTFEISFVIDPGLVEAGKQRTGNYGFRFIANADAAHVVDEANEDNNRGEVWIATKKSAIPPWVWVIPPVILVPIIIVKAISTLKKRARVKASQKKAVKVEQEAEQGMEPTPMVAEVPPRYINTCFTQASSHTVVPKNFNLCKDTWYDLRLDIGPLSPDSAVLNAPKHPLPAHLLPQTKDGHWLEIVAVSDDFTIPPQISHHIFLPRSGSAWVCDCNPKKKHTCNEATRQPYFFLSMKTPESIGKSHLRLCVYYAKNLIQSQTYICEVGKREKAGKGYTSLIDYTLTSKLTDVGALPERMLNILVNQNKDGTHKLVINGRDDNPLHFNLTTEQMTYSMQSVRDALERIQFHKKSFGRRVYRFKADNSKTKAEMIEDITQLAQLGWKLWSTLLGKVIKVEQVGWLDKPASIQISRVGGSNFVFPWNFLYEYYLESDVDPSKYKICRLLHEWDGTSPLARSETSGCPYESEHGPKNKNTICPYGFWGYKHDIEQPPSIKEWHPYVQKQKHALEMAIGLSSRLDNGLTQRHVKNLRKSMPEFVVKEYMKTKELRKALADCLDVVYFYCHGKHESSGKLDTYIEIGDGNKITAYDISGWQRTEWPENHWEERSPLVFINGCHTIDVTPESWANFVDSFAGVDAAGVIGTEVTISQQIASEAAEEFFSRFKDNKPIIDALQTMRWHLLSKGNLLGLAYTGYCFANLSLFKSGHPNKRRR